MISEQEHTDNTAIFFNFLREPRSLSWDSHTGYNVAGTSNNICHNVNSSSPPRCLRRSMNCSLLETSSCTFSICRRITTLPQITDSITVIRRCCPATWWHGACSWVVFIFSPACERGTLSSSAPPPRNSCCRSVSARGCSSLKVSFEEHRWRVAAIFLKTAREIQTRCRYGEHLSLWALLYLTAE